MEIILEDLNKTKEIAEIFAKCVKDDGAFVALHGTIGAGKTTFTRYMLKALGVKKNVTSPTFVLLNEYHEENHIPVYHFDLYRLEHEGVKTISSELQEYIKDGVLTLVEWADFGKENLPKGRIDIEINYGTHTKNKDLRIMKINATDNPSKKIVNNVENCIKKIQKELERMC